MADDPEFAKYRVELRRRGYNLDDSDFVMEIMAKSLARDTDLRLTTEERARL